MSRIRILKKGITDLHIDTVVNAANTWLQQGRGVCGAIFAAAGPYQLQRACDRIGGCPTGQAVITPGFNLCRYIIHAVGPIYNDGHHGEPQQLYSCYRNSLDLARQHDCHVIGFPLISAGIYGYPQKEAWRKALQAANDWINDNKDFEMEIQFAILSDSLITMGKSMADELGIVIYE